RHGDMVAAGLPFLVASEASSGRLLGFAYAGYFRPRPAYRFTLEDSIYVAPAVTRCGIGRALLARLIADATARGFRQMIAMIGDSGNAASIGLHEQAGFARAGLLPAAGFKLGRWIDCVVMQRRLGDAPRLRRSKPPTRGTNPEKKRAAPKRGPSLGRKRLEDVRQVVGRRPMPQCTI